MPTPIGLHLNGNASALVTGQATVPSQAATTFAFGQDARFARGDQMSINVEPSAATPANVNLQCEWISRRST